MKYFKNHANGFSSVNIFDNFILFKLKLAQNQLGLCQDGPWWGLFVQKVYKNQVLFHLLPRIRNYFHFRGHHLLLLLLRCIHLFLFVYDIEFGFVLKDKIWRILLNSYQGNLSFLLILEIRLNCYLNYLCQTSFQNAYIFSFH